MTSRGDPQECFVHIVLPGETEFVTAGRFRRTTDRHGVATGRFVYGKSYLARENAVPIDPIELKLSGQTYQTRLFRGIFGALRDASPDHWGRRIIERHLGSPAPDELDYVLHSPNDRAGALGFGLNREPPAPRRKFNRTIDLEKLQEFADAVVEDSDDHPRNHAVIAMETDWKLSPAYDLIPSMPVSIEERFLALSCGDQGRIAHADNLLSQAQRFLLKTDEANAIIDELEQTVKDRWYDIARREGVTEKDCKTIMPAFTYEGFRLEAP